MNLPKKLAFLIFFLLLIAGLLQTKIIHAQTNCKKESDPEYHSLRPYPAEPCDEEVKETALFCGNSLIISDTVSAFQTIPPELDENCTSIGNNRYRCTYRKSNSRTIAIDLSDAELPIMGNTELVVNSQEQPDPEGLDDAEKVNEYVSWYLNGIINRAEYPFLDPTDEEDLSKIVNFSGPLKKLLPWDEQIRNRIKTIERAVGEDINKDGRVEEKDRHNQVFACTFGIPIKIFGIWEVARVAQIPVPCYDKGFLSRFADFFDLKDEKRLSEWKNYLPPLAEDYDDFQDYWVSYKRWRGETCAVAEVPGFIPVVGGKKFIYCFDNPAKPNYWANLFPYIPFSSTEDSVGLVELDSFGVQPVSEDVTITNVSIKDWSPAELYFAHMQEVSELAEILQQTFVPKDGNMVGGVTGVSPGGACDLVNIRTNEGDDLFAGEIGGTLSYDAEFSCNFDRNATESACIKQAIVSLSVLTKTPKADEVWERTVAGPAAIFKRIFPKVGPGGAILGILDIPAATKVTYTGVDYAGNPDNQRSGEGAELYFPHIGGVSEYLLKGIQTILRPKGFGEQIISGQPGTTTIGGACEAANEACTPSLDSRHWESAGCSYGSGNIEGSSKLKEYLVKAANYFGVPPQFLAGILWVENRGGVYSYSSQQVEQYSKPGSFDPNTCQPNACGAVGPMQLSAKPGFDVNLCPAGEAAADNWKEWCNFRSGAADIRGDPNYLGNPANILDAFAVAAKKFASIGGSGCAGWSEDTVKLVAERYYGSCKSPHIFPSLYTLLNNLSAGAASNYAKTESGALTYCEFVWGYYDTHK